MCHRLLDSNGGLLDFFFVRNEFPRGCAIFKNTSDTLPSGTCHWMAGLQHGRISVLQGEAFKGESHKISRQEFAFAFLLCLTQCPYLRYHST